MTSEWKIEKIPGRPTTLKTGNMDGIAIEINKRRRTLCIYGWYDGCVGIGGAELSFDDILPLMNTSRSRKGGDAQAR